MLRRRSIRTKLVVALGLLSAIVVLLAISSFWGLHRYQSVAETIEQRAWEIPVASELNRWAESLQDSNKRLIGLHSSNGVFDSLIFHRSMIESSEPESVRPDGSEHDDSVLHRARVTVELGTLYQALNGCRMTLSRYEDAMAAASPETPLFDDSENLQLSLVAIGESLDQIDALLHNPKVNFASHESELSEEADALVKQTRAHLYLVHDGMAEISHDMRGEYHAAAAWFFLVLAIVLMLALVWLFTSLIVQPFRTLLEGSRLVARGQFDHRIDLGSGDELCELAEAMNDMTDRFQVAYRQLHQVCSDLDREVRQRTREVIQNEQLASVGFLAAGVAHEINNPLATIAWSAESLESRIEDIAQCASDERHVDDEVLSALQTNLRRIQDEAFRCKGITERLLDFSRLGEVKRAPTDLTTLVQDVVEMVGKVGKFRCKTLRAACDPETIADVNPQEIRQVVLNLLTNALESVGPDGAVDVQVRRRADQILISVADDGCGMTPEVLQHLFEPFFTRRSDGSGTGLGLSISYRIISQHGGTLTPSSDGVGKGSRFELALPIHSAMTDQLSPSNPPTRWNHESYQAA